MTTQPIELSDTDIEILGTVCFVAAPIAKALIAAGIYENKASKAEYEQAVFIHWALGLRDEHGDEWRHAGHAILSELSVPS